jgi:alpha-N-arabinofuranosidase
MVQFQADPAKTVRSTSWYVWSLFAKYVFTETLPTTSDFDPLYYVAGRNNETGAHIFKAAVYNATEPVAISLSFDGLAAGSSAELTLLTGPENVYEVNDPADPSKNVVVETVSTITSDAKGVFKFSMPDQSVGVLTTVPREEKKKRHWQRIAQ